MQDIPLQQIPLPVSLLAEWIIIILPSFSEWPVIWALKNLQTGIKQSYNILA
jgi:hypothetical protein